MKPKQQEEEKQVFGQNQPIVESHISTSKDGRYLIHKTVITDIKPVKYYQKVMENKGEN